MQDRIPVYPGRVKLIPVSGQANTYDMIRADAATQEGTPLNKNSLLKDSTAERLNLTASTATPDDALNAICTEMRKKVELMEIARSYANSGSERVVTVPDLSQFNYLYFTLEVREAREEEVYFYGASTIIPCSLFRSHPKNKIQCSMGRGSYGTESYYIIYLSDTSVSITGSDIEGSEAFPSYGILYAVLD